MQYRVGNGLWRNIKGSGYLHNEFSRIMQRTYM
jgi:hypothetical protein